MESMIIATKSQNHITENVTNLKFIYMYICNAVLKAIATVTSTILPIQSNQQSSRVAVANRPTAAAEYF